MPGAQDLITSAAGLLTLPRRTVIRDAAEMIAEDFFAQITGSIEHQRVQNQPHDSWPVNEPATADIQASADEEHAAVQNTPHDSWPANGSATAKIAASKDIEHAKVMAQPHDSWPVNEPATALIDASWDIEHARVKAKNSGSSMMNDIVSELSFTAGVAVQNRYQISIPTMLLAQNSNKIFNLIQSIPATANLSMDWMFDYYAGDMGQAAVELAAYCDKTQLPGYQFQTETVRHYGPSFKIPHMPEYQDITMSFMCSSGFWERYFFDAWMYMVMDPVTNNFNYKDEYAVDVIIASIIPGGAPILDWNNMNYWTKLVDCFPISIQEQEVGYDMNNSIQKVVVTFSYKYAIPFTGKGSTTATPLRGTKATFQQGISLNPTAKPPS